MQLPPDDPVMKRLTDQLNWYRASSKSAKRWFKTIKIIEIVLAAMIPFLTGLITKEKWMELSYVVGACGVLITIFEGLLHLNQYQEHWTSYRNTAESLKHEKFLFEAGANPYSDPDTARALLAERVEALLSQENTQWVSMSLKAGQTTTTKGGS